MARYIPSSTNLLTAALAVVILWQCADWFVQGAVGLAERLHVPPMLVGLTLVSLGMGDLGLGTTAEVQGVIYAGTPPPWDEAPPE